MSPNEKLVIIYKYCLVGVGLGGVNELDIKSSLKQNRPKVLVMFENTIKIARHSAAYCTNVCYKLHASEVLKYVYQQVLRQDNKTSA